jgi:DNA-binding PadR family transcriptional regulator
MEVINELLGAKERAILGAVSRGAFRARARASQLPELASEPAGELMLYDTLRRFEAAGLVRSRRGVRGREYALTSKGRALLRMQHRFQRALFGLVVRSA